MKTTLVKIKFLNLKQKMKKVTKNLKDKIIINNYKIKVIINKIIVNNQRKRKKKSKLMNKDWRNFN